MIVIKTEEEIECMRVSGRAVGETLTSLSQFIEPGMTTKEIDQEAGRLIKATGGIPTFLGYRGFPGNICISVNEEIVHGIGGTRKVNYGDLLKMDVGITIDGWVGDSAITIPVGAIDAETQKLVDATDASLWAGIKQARAGNKLGDVCSTIEKTILDRGYYIVREFVGHGVGSQLHEDPQIPNYGRAGQGPRLKAGMTLAIEPMVNMGTAGIKMMSDGWTVITADRKPSAHIEHTVLVTDGDPEILTPRAGLKVPEGVQVHSPVAS
ncbi:MAG: type I methionyl aminopeptidase [Verrucomicrobiota bacterium]